MPNYDATWFNPPGPLAQVKLRNPRSNTGLSDVPMLLDSGADVTILPDATAVALGLDMIPDGRYELIGFGGGRVLARAVQRHCLSVGGPFADGFCWLSRNGA